MLQTTGSSNVSEESSDEREKDSEEKGKARSEEKGEACTEENGGSCEGNSKKATPQRGCSRLCAGPSRLAKMAGNRDTVKSEAVLHGRRLRVIQSFACARVWRSSQLP